MVWLGLNLAHRNHLKPPKNHRDGLTSTFSAWFGCSFVSGFWYKTPLARRAGEENKSYSGVDFKPFKISFSILVETFSSTRIWRWPLLQTRATLLMANCKIMILPFPISECVSAVVKNALTTFGERSSTEIPCEMTCLFSAEMNELMTLHSISLSDFIPRRCQFAVPWKCLSNLLLVFLVSWQSESLILESDLRTLTP